MTNTHTRTTLEGDAHTTKTIRKKTHETIYENTQTKNTKKIRHMLNYIRMLHTTAPPLRDAVVALIILVPRLGPRCGLRIGLRG